MAYIKDQSHGNYRHYYVRRRANEQYPLPLERDERLALFDRELFKGKRILDVGCNSGEVTVELGMSKRGTFGLSRSC
jgi:7SK snRNA methylphosphate capping enzyme